MLKTYKIVNLDCKMSGDIPQVYQNDPDIARALARVMYRPLLRNWRQKRSDALFILDDEYNRGLADGYWDMAGQAHAIAPCGELVFERIWCLGRDGLRVDVENGVLFLGHAVNWGRDYFNWWIETSGVGFIEWASDEALIADFGEPERHDDNVVMMKYPGYGIFGHWLLDYVPQLAITRHMAMNTEAKFVFDHLADWMKVLLDAAGIEHVECYQHKLTEHRNLRMPTGMKCGYALAQPINSLAWNALRAHFNHANCTHPPAGQDKLFISRRNWGGQRGLSDYTALENALQSLGFSVYYPEQHSLQEQAHVFSTARFIVGEDGSALHSAIFTDPGAVLGVLMQEDRYNLWHAGICDTMGHRIAYHRLPAGPDGVELDIGAIEGFARRLLQA
ncbi:hypothetical protein CLG96_14745 [Sphingomonas oleivorans]|uniref:Glycosyltransferase 61 catalytic domain-containing protein n=1 Tax=Sphingomonas oleivorans TaxID=1735121 RepID=A0A2T5FV85_9SPHN|nr:glycosyltransferase 61 family protein [Sphingomonas oleivorans]PTQ09112.1 hypothetical protein CLG96_14745 [Sphingomonas oleivorans]